MMGVEPPARENVAMGSHIVGTVQLRTPLRVLSRHRELHETLSTEPPVIAREQWEGIWVPTTRSFRELGIDIAEPSLSLMASDIGPIAADGGE